MTTSPLPAGPRAVAPAGSPCCAEYAGLSRRGLFRGLALAGATTAIGSAVVTASPARAASASSVLVVVSLRGAADGLSLVVPHGDPAYYRARPRIAVPSESLLAKDAMFGLHPQLSPLLPLWTSGRLAAIQATGLPVANRSHFSAMEELEDAAPGSTARVGWLNRLIGGDADASPLEGLHVGLGVVPTSLYGGAPVFAVKDVDSVEIPGADQYDTTGGRPRSLRTLWGGDTSPLGRGVRATFDSVQGFAPVQRAVDRRGRYPSTDLGRALADVARVVRGDVGVEVVTVDQGDWDMHTNLGTLEWGDMRRNAADLAGSVAAFFDDLGPTGDKVTMVVLSEFGRRVVENSNQGLDHGYGNVMLVAGAGVRGGRYYGRWPGLDTTLDADLLVTTDYRQVLGEVVASRFADASMARVFPGLSYDPVGFMRTA